MQTSIISKKTKGSLKSKGVVFKTILILSLFFISTFGTVNDISVNKNDGNDIIQDFDTESLSVAADGIDNLVFSDDFNDFNYDGWIVDEGNWTVSNGYLRSKGWEQFYNYPNTKRFHSKIRRDLGSQIPFNNISLDFDYRFETPFSTGIRQQTICVNFWLNESTSFTLMVIEEGSGYNPQRNDIELVRDDNNVVTSYFNSTKFTPDSNWHSVNMTIVDNKISVKYDGTIVINQHWIPEFEYWSFSAFSVEFGGWDDTVSDSYRNVDNIILKSSGNTSQEYPFVTTWGTEGTDDGQFNSPYEIAVNGSGNVYVSDTLNHRVQVFSPTGQFIRKWGTQGSEAGQFNAPFGIAINSTGHVYIAERDNHRIQVFTSTGDYLFGWGSYGSGDGQFKSLEGIAVNASGYIYVADYSNYRVQVFSPSGEFVRKWGSYGSGDGQFNIVCGIAIDSEGNVYVTEMGRRVQVFTQTGQFIRKWGSYGFGDGEFHTPRGLCVDENDLVFVVEHHNQLSRVQVFTKEGIFITKWGSLGTNEGEFNTPGAAASNKNGAIYVTDCNNDRIQVFGHLNSLQVPNAPYLNTITSPSTTGNITLSWGAAPGATSYKIYRSNLPITSVTGLQPIKTGHTLLSYADVGLTNGTYYYVVVATNGSGDSEISNCRSVSVGIPENLTLNADFSQTRNFSAFGHSVLVNNSFISPTVHNNKVFNSWNLHPEEGFERFYSFMGELKNLRTSLLELGLPSHFVDFLDFLISDDDSIRLLINLNVISNFSAKPIEELFFDLKDITDFFNKYFIDPNISLTIPDAIAPFLNDPRIDMWFDITSGAKSNKILQLKDNLEPIEAIINIVNMFFRIDISILTYRDNVVVPVTFRLSDLIESAQFAYNVLKLVGKIAALAAVGFVNPLGWVQTLATTYIIMHEFIFDPPWIVKAILNSIYTNLTDHINNTFYGFKSTSNWIYATAKFLDPPAARLDLALYNQQGNMILGYDKASNSSVQKSSAGFVLGDENAQFMVLYSDPGAKYDLKITNTALNGEGQTELDYQLLVYQPNSTQSNIFEGYLDLGEETSTKIVLPEKGQRFTFPQLDISLLKSEYPFIEIQILDENGNPVEVDTIKLYLNNVELEFDYKYLGNGKYQISNFALQENEQLIYQIVVSKAGYLMNSMRFSLFESQGNAATIPIIVAVILVSLMAVVVVLVRNRKKKTKIEQLASPKDELDKFFDFDV